MKDAERSWTDAITNATVFAGFNSLQYLNWLENRPASVNCALPQFLHEATHHWCFHSVVGNAIALLRMRARRACSPDSPIAATHLQEDIVRYEAATTMMRPISEGLALFAEFDLRLGASRVISGTLGSTLNCFGFAAVEHAQSLEQHMERAVHVLLFQMRSQSQFIERKAHLFAHPHECGEGYLAGYMSVKALYTSLISRCPALEDRDLFLSFLRSYLYDDPGFALTILSDERNSANRIANYVCSRFSILLDDRSLSQTVATWEAAVAAGTMDYRSIGSSDNASYKAFLRTLECFADEMVQGSDLAVHAFATMKERRFLVLSRVKARVTVTYDGSTRVTAIDDPGIVFELDQGPEPGEYDGELVIVTSTAIAYLVLLLVVHPSCYVVKKYVGDFGDDWEDLKCHAVNHKSTTTIQDGLERILQNHIASLPKYRDARERARHSSLVRAEDLYGKLATLNVCVEDRSNTLITLHDQGISALLGYDNDLVRGLATIGIANMVTTDIQEIKAFAKRSMIDSSVVDRSLVEAVERNGMRLILYDGEHALALV